MLSRMSGQVFKIAISPAQRMVLLNLSHGQAEKITDSAEGKRYRRFLRGFGIAHIAKLMREYNAVAAKQARDEKTTNSVEVTVENVEYALKVWGASHSPLDEDIAGDLFDLLDDAKAGKDLPDTDAPVLDLDADKALWLPPQAPDGPTD